jgi:hypothetical protein
MTSEQLKAILRESMRLDPPPKAPPQPRDAMKESNENLLQTRKLVCNLR